MRKFLLSLFVWAWATASGGLAQAPEPRLVVLLAVDQFRGDYPDRFAAHFSGGLRRLFAEGRHYANADLNYASTETGPGHATMATGTYPRVHGIHGNDWIDRTTGRSVYCVGDPEAGPVDGLGGGSSPRNLRVSALGDWLKAASPRSKVVAISGKDRAAVLLGGQRPDAAYWYESRSGQWVSSSYYLKRLPEWVRRYNARRWVYNQVPEAWTRLEPESLYARQGPDAFPFETPWNGSTAFPHPFDPARKPAQVGNAPFLDAYTLDFAWQAVRAERLGRRGVVDLLCIGLSATDYVGHAFGPDSHELLDQLLRLDRELGRFLERLERYVGRDRLLVILTADHGVLELPEFLEQFRGLAARRLLYGQAIEPGLERLNRALGLLWGVEEPLLLPGYMLNYAAAARVGVDSLTLERYVREGLLRIPGVADVYLRRELMREGDPDRPYLGHFRRSYHPPRGEDLQIRYCERCLVTSRPTGTTHGSPYRYDTHVPIVFWGAGVRPGRVAEPVYTVDIAPTVARLLGIPYPDTVSGRPLDVANR
ncbi:MAG: alkaline phosphatase family protein [Bacteroidetes bacterium]|nr:alkaline phosphatase family protein [Rhodothermia bacterium]MCS7154449.1 alkaline phosphatase family protein [Bacteroidota bacterium]MCX7906822.1 alkaline phosphatase family protein [Bacteroidota bacterium]MDW8136899.1 alkaline phosphatase family protein [Bacteroidota bacterium]MDW8285231.1 alkaline phosphatase family protein [Bacteroidota bacterium]